MKQDDPWRLLQSLQDELMAHDIDIDETMCAWTEDEMRAYLESGGEARPPWRPADPELWKRWFPYWQPRDQPARLRLICCHPRGSSANYWYAKDPRGTRLSPFLIEASFWLEMLAIETPGRMERHNEECIRDMNTLTDAVAEILRPMLMDGSAIPYALVGHSMGSWVAYALHLRLLELGVHAPVAFFANCFPSPHLPHEKWPWVHGSHPPQLSADDTLPQEEVMYSVAIGVPEEAFRPEQLRRWWPANASDHYIYDTYEFPGDRACPPPLPCPLYTTWATEDRLGTEELVSAWEALAGKAKGGYERCDLVGAHHMFLKDDEHRVEWMKWALEKLRPLAGIG